MQLYADTPARRTRQLLADALGILWIIGSIWLAVTLHALVVKLAGPGVAMADAGKGLAKSMQDASDNVSDVPLVGSSLSKPFDGMAAAAKGLSNAGLREQAAVHDLALLLALVVAGFPILFVLLVWALPRLVWMRRAGAARRVLTDRDGLDLLALRALANQPLRKLAATDDGMLDRWRRGDQATIEQLAGLELQGLGVRVRRAPLSDPGPQALTS